MIIRRFPSFSDIPKVYSWIEEGRGTVTNWSSTDSLESSDILDKSYHYGYDRRSDEHRIIPRRGSRGNRRLYEIEKGLYSRNPKLKLGPVRKMMWRLVLFIMALFFFAAAYVQHNDPDSYLWMLVYIVPVFVNVNLIISLPVGHWTFLNKLITIHMAYCYTLGFWTLAYFIHGKMATNPSTILSEPNMFAEEAKELIGLCLVIAWLSFVSNGNFLKFGGKGVVFGATLTALPIVTWIFLEELEGDVGECN